MTIKGGSLLSHDRSFERRTAVLGPCSHVYRACRAVVCANTHAAKPYLARLSDGGPQMPSAKCSRRICTYVRERLKRNRQNSAHVLFGTSPQRNEKIQKKTFTLNLSLCPCNIFVLLSFSCHVPPIVEKGRLGIWAQESLWGSRKSKGCLSGVNKTIFQGRRWK